MKFGIYLYFVAWYLVLASQRLTWTWHFLVHVRAQASHPMQFSGWATDMTLLPISSPYSSSPVKGLSISSSTSIAADLEAPSAADALLHVDRIDEFRRPRLPAAGGSGDGGHCQPPVIKQSYCSREAVVLLSWSSRKVASRSTAFRLPLDCRSTVPRPTSTLSLRRSCRRSALEALPRSEKRISCRHRPCRSD